MDAKVKRTILLALAGGGTAEEIASYFSVSVAEVESLRSAVPVPESIPELQSVADSPTPVITEQMRVEMRKDELANLAERHLKASDWVSAKAFDEQIALSVDWRNWRKFLRRAFNRQLTQAELNSGIYPEPPRYTSAPQPSDPSTPPPEVLAEAQPDEDLVELKARLLGEFASLRNMLIGHIPMTEAQLLRLQALEHPKFQTWLQA